MRRTSLLALSEADWAWSGVVAAKTATDSRIKDAAKCFGRTFIAKASCVEWWGAASIPRIDRESESRGIEELGARDSSGFAVSPPSGSRSGRLTRIFTDSALVTLLPVASAGP